MEGFAGSGLTVASREVKPKTVRLPSRRGGLLPAQLEFLGAPDCGPFRQPPCPSWFCCCPTSTRSRSRSPEVFALPLARATTGRETVVAFQRVSSQPLPRAHRRG